MRAILSQFHKRLGEAGKPRSPRWPSVRAAHLKREPWCRLCGGTEDLEVHHIRPFHLCPGKELDPANLITLCDSRNRECHLRAGHIGNWSRFNPAIRYLARSPHAGQATVGY